MLGEISETGVLTDKRKYAKGKLPGYQSDYALSMKFGFTGNLIRHISTTKTYDIGTNNYTKLRCELANPDYNSWVAGYYDLVTGAYGGGGGSWSNGAGSIMYLRFLNTEACRVVITKTGSVISFNFVDDSSTPMSLSDFIFEVY